MSAGLDWQELVSLPRAACRVGLAWFLASICVRPGRLAVAARACRAGPVRGPEPSPGWIGRGPGLLPGRPGVRARGRRTFAGKAGCEIRDSLPGRPGVSEGPREIYLPGRPDVRAGTLFAGYLPGRPGVRGRPE